MANQYGNVEVKFVKCKAAGCRNLVRVTPSKIRKGSGKYCSPQCTHKSKKPTKYTKKVVKYITDNINTLSRSDIASHLGVTLDSLKKFLTLLRKTNKSIPVDRQPAKIGEIRVRICRGKEREYIKTADGWKSYTSPEKRQKAQVPEPPVRREPKRPAILFQPEPEMPAKTRLLLPNGGFVICDSDKVNSTIKYLQSKTA